MNGIEDYRAFLTKVSEEAGIPAFKPSEDGLVSMRVDDAYNVNFQFVEATGKVLCFIEVAQLPPDASKAVYRDLLVGGLFGKDTAGGYFSLEPETTFSTLRLRRTTLRNSSIPSRRSSSSATSGPSA